MPIIPRAGVSFWMRHRKLCRALLWRGYLETGDVASLRVDAGEDVPDHAVLACCVHALQHNQHRLGLRRVEIPAAVRRDELYPSRSALPASLSAMRSVVVVEKFLRRTVLPGLTKKGLEIFISFLDALSCSRKGRSRAVPQVRTTVRPESGWRGWPVKIQSA